MNKIFWFLKLIAVAGFVASILILFQQKSDRKNGELIVSFLDVGQGDSILIETPDGMRVLIDGGPVGSALVPLSKEFPVGKISAIVATHPDLDHIGGLLGVIEKRKVEKVLFSSYKTDDRAEESLNELIVSKEIPTREISRGDRVILSKEPLIFLDILWPPKDLPAEAGNNMSLVAVLRFASSSVLLSGDAPKGVERILVKGGDLIDVDILKLGHHGSKTSSDEQFLIATSPRFAIVSAGKDNRYNHPAKEVVERVSSLDVPIFSTIEYGNLTFSTKGDGVWKLLVR